jgi:RNA polymerase subunit RPABC4/transcription elongation factor Spt4
VREVHDILFEKAVEGMTAEEVLNYYRNLYHAEPQSTEHGVIANALNDILPRMVLPSCKVCEKITEANKDIFWTFARTHQPGTREEFLQIPYEETRFCPVCGREITKEGKT